MSDTGAGLLGGELALHFENTVILTVVVAAFVLWRYRAAILRGMRTGTVRTLPVPMLPRSGTAVPSGIPAAAVLLWERRARRRQAIAYLLAVGVCALLLGAIYVHTSGRPFSPSYLALMAFVYLMAAAPMIGLTLALPFWRGLAASIALLLACAMSAFAVALIHRAFLGKPPTLVQLNLLRVFLRMAWTQLWLPALLLVLTGATRLRGVAPITFAGLLVFGLAPFAGSRATQWLSATERGTRWAVWLGLDGMFVLIALPAGWLAWKRLQAVAAAYEAKRFSDAQLLARTWWLMLVASVGLELISARPRPALSVLACTVAYLGFPAVSAFLLGCAGIGRDRPPPRTLLLLRVFGYTARTERLFDRVGARWRLLGPVTMIAAPDVAARAIAPGAYLRYLTGRLADAFVRSRADLDARLSAIDLAPDPDGRFRVNALCCSDDTWQATVVELISRADAVIMDARGFTRERRGCEFELRELAERMPLSKVVLVIDTTTERGLVAEALGPASGAVRLISVERATGAETRAVFGALVDAACA